MLKTLDWLEKTAKKDDLVVFAFFGNGAPLGERSCYFTVDSTLKDRAKNAVAAAEIEQHMDKLKSQRFVALVDPKPGQARAGTFHTFSMHRIHAIRCRVARRSFEDR